MGSGLKEPVEGGYPRKIAGGRWTGTLTGHKGDCLEKGQVCLVGGDGERAGRRMQSGRERGCRGQREANGAGHIGVTL